VNDDGEEAREKKCEWKKRRMQGGIGKKRERDKRKSKGRKKEG